MRCRSLVLTLGSLALLAGLAALFAGFETVTASWSQLRIVAAAGVALLGRLSGALIYGYLRTPEMIIGVGTAMVLPFVALLSLSVRWLARRRADRRRISRMLAGSMQGGGLARTLPAPNGKAWLEMTGHAGAPALEIGGELVRIGHDADNDLALPYLGIQPFHMLIRRTPEQDFLVIDVTGSGGKGIAVNGRRLRSCPLQDGDRIELGGFAVTFRRTCPGRQEQIAV